MNKVFRVEVEMPEGSRMCAEDVSCTLIRREVRLSENCEVIVTEIKDEPDELKVGDRNDGKEKAMSELKVGDTVLVKAEVLSVGSYGGVKVRLPQNAGDRDFSEGYFVRVDPDELKVGDRIQRIRDADTIAEVVTAYRLKFTDGGISTALWRRDELTKLPAEPTYRVEYKDDSLRLLRDGIEIKRIAMSHDPLIVLYHIDLWARDTDIDTDEVRKTIAEPQELGEVVVMRFVTMVAIRHAIGWMVECRNAAPGMMENHTAIVPYDVAHAYFPTIDGRYLEKP